MDQKIWLTLEYHLRSQPHRKTGLDLRKRKSRQSWSHLFCTNHLQEVLFNWYQIFTRKMKNIQYSESFSSKFFSRFLQFFLQFPNSSLDDSHLNAKKMYLMVKSVLNRVSVVGMANIRTVIILYWNMKRLQSTNGHLYWNKSYLKLKQIQI